MPDFLQADHPLKLTTPLGPDVLLPAQFRATEGISQLFHFRLELLADLKFEVKFEQILGQSVTLEMRLPDGELRYFNGIVNRFSQTARDETFHHFRAEIVPKFWLLTKKVRSRTFQHMTTIDILKSVLAGMDVSYRTLATYKPRDYCVQYRESDFAFASRIMEEEGIYYYFQHSDGSHKLFVTDSTSPNPTVPGHSTITYEEDTGEFRREMRITGWDKTQELRSGEYTLWDHCFELPTNHLEGKEKTADSVQVGKVTHKLKVGGNDQLEIYDWPGGYAERFDGISPSGGDRPSDLQNIFTDRERIARVRMEEEETGAIQILGVGDCGNFSPGFKFTLERHFNADGKYLLTQVEHQANQNIYGSNDQVPFSYQNSFQCVPDDLRFRPTRITPKPVIAGSQTATVVGPAGEEIFVDKYGRVKVQFHWDREGKKDAGSSCWIRVAQFWAGKGWGAFFWPRIGHEVVVSFEEGDPDQPLIVGSVYNAENMPWYSLPINKQLGGLKSASERGKAHSDFNAIVFNDEQDKEHLSIHSEHNLSLNSEDDKMIHAGRHKGERVALANTLTVGKIVPMGGGSGGGYDEGNPMPDPPPTGIVGLNSVFTYGDNFQAAVPLNHQLVIGNNVQMCINPLALAAGAPGASPSQALQALCGAGMGGSMQFTVGTNAQFTLGQTFEISIGPPKIEIHAPYKDHLPVSILCGVASLAAIVFMIAYDVLKAPNNSDAYNNATNAQDKAAAKQGEQSGDQERAALVLVFQMLTDVLLVAILSLEAAADQIDWVADKTMRELYEIDKACLEHWLEPGAAKNDDADAPWNETGTAVVGAVGIATALIAEMALAAK